MELVLKAGGMKPMDVVRAVISTNAEILGISHLTGTVEAGKAADFIVLAENPLDDMAVFEDPARNVLMVVKEGPVVKDLLGRQVLKEMPEQGLHFKSDDQIPGQSDFVESVSREQEERFDRRHRMKARGHLSMVIRGVHGLSVYPGS